MTSFDLNKKIPYFPEWEIIDQFFENKRFGDLSLQVAGITAQNRLTSEISTGSAAGWEGEILCRARANYELMERISILEDFKRREISVYESFNSLGRIIETIPGIKVFPQSNSNDWRYAFSNGIALHKQKEIAIRSAHLELIERDAVLRSWYGETIPKEITSIAINHLQSEILSSLPSSYQISIYQFQDSVEKNNIRPNCKPTSIVGIFAFPQENSSETPFIYGFASEFESSPSKVINKAFKETIQRLLFLQGEELPSEVPPFSPSPLYHQEFFLHSEGLTKLKSWLQGENYHGYEVFPFESYFHDDYLFQDNQNEEKIKDVQFVNLTPSGCHEFFVIKAIDNFRIPLVFGKNYSFIKNVNINLQGLEIHPIA